MIRTVTVLNRRAHPSYFVSDAYYRAWVGGSPLVRARRRGGGNVSRRLRELILRRDGRTCAECHRSDRALTIDHLIPWVFGGSNHPDNLRPVCGACNSACWRRDFANVYADAVTRERGATC